MNAQPNKTILLPYTALAFLTNFFWESWHGILLYAESSQYSGNILSYVQINTVASLQDATSLLLLFLLFAIIYGGIDWYQSLTHTKVLLFTLVSIAGAYIVEWYATDIAGWWSYNEMMPLVFGVGLSPLVQIFITGMITLALLRIAE